jgi:hypothetical protein
MLALVPMGGSEFGASKLIGDGLDGLEGSMVVTVKFVQFEVVVV